MNLEACSGRSWELIVDGFEFATFLEEMLRADTS